MSIRWPLTGHISSPFGDTNNRLNPHSGTDITGPNGSPIRAGATGRVHHVGPNTAASGNVVTIIYNVRGGKLYALYCHVQARYPVRVGQKVRRGTIIAYVGSSGNSRGGHTHIGCFLGGRLVNPETYFGGTVTAGGNVTPIIPTISQEQTMKLTHYVKKVVDVPGIAGVRNATYKNVNRLFLYGDTFIKSVSQAEANLLARSVGSSKKTSEAGVELLTKIINENRAALAGTSTVVSGTGPTATEIAAETIRQMKLAGN